VPTHGGTVTVPVIPQQYPPTRRDQNRARRENVTIHSRHVRVSPDEGWVDDDRRNGKGAGHAGESNDTAVALEGPSGLE